MSKRPTYEAFKAEALSDPEVKAEYDALEDDYQLKRRMIAMRKAAGLTQEQMAEKLGTKKSSISRLESINAENSPRLATIEDYARVLGYVTKVDFEPMQQTGDGLTP